MEAINNHNFVRFYPVGMQTDTNLFPKLRFKNYPKSVLLFVAGETYSFYVNTKITLTIEDLTIVTDINLTQVAATSTITQLEDYTHISFVMPQITSSKYVRIGLKTGGALVLMSNYGFVTTDSSFSSIVKYKHNENIYQYNYTEGFYNQLRLSIFETERQTEYNIEQYRDVYKETLRNYKEKLYKYISFEALEFDDYFSDALTIMLQHNEIYINNEKLSFKAGVKIEETKSKFELWLDSFVEDKTDITSYTPIFAFTFIKTENFTKICGVNGTGSSEAFSKTYYGNTQLELDAVVLADLSNFNTQGQNNANEIGICTYEPFYASRNQLFAKNNCPEHYTSNFQAYYYKQYESIYSQVDADNKRDTDPNYLTEGANYVNALPQGVCTFVPYQVGDFIPLTEVVNPAKYGVTAGNDSFGFNTEAVNPIQEWYGALVFGNDGTGGYSLNIEGFFGSSSVPTNIFCSIRLEVTRNGETIWLDRFSPSIGFSFSDTLNFSILEGDINSRLTVYFFSVNGAYTFSQSIYVTRVTLNKTS